MVCMENSEQMGLLRVHIHPGSAWSGSLWTERGYPPKTGRDQHVSHHLRVSSRDNCLAWLRLLIREYFWKPSVLWHWLLCILVSYFWSHIFVSDLLSGIPPQWQLPVDGWSSWEVVLLMVGQTHSWASPCTHTAIWIRKSRTCPECPHHSTV